MAIKYHYFKNPVDGDHPEQEGKLHPRIVSSKKITLDQLCHKLSLGSSFNAAQASGVLKAFSKVMIEELTNGNYIHWDGFGVFSVSLEADPVTDPKEMFPSRVRIKRLHFRPFKNVKLDLAEAKMIRSDLHPSLPYFTKEERKENILNYLAMHETVQSIKCIEFNGCSRTTAGRDLKELQQEGLIRRIALYGGCLYTLAENPNP